MFKFILVGHTQNYEQRREQALKTTACRAIEYNGEQTTANEYHWVIFGNTDEIYRLKVLRSRSLFQKSLEATSEHSLKY